MEAIYSLPGATNTVGLRVGCCIAYAVATLALCIIDKTDALGVGLGICMVAMTVLFLIVVSKLTIDMKSFAWGLVPHTVPKGSMNVILSLVGTTSVGFNLFLGSAMGEGKQLKQAQRGIAFSVTSALVVSVLILLIGDGAYHDAQVILKRFYLDGVVLFYV